MDIFDRDGTGNAKCKSQRTEIGPKFLFTKNEFSFSLYGTVLKNDCLNTFSIRENEAVQVELTFKKDIENTKKNVNIFFFRIVKTDFLI